MKTAFEARLPTGHGLTKEHVPSLFARWEELEAFWGSLDPTAERVLLEYHFDDWLDNPDQRWYFLVRVNGQWLPQPLPYGLLVLESRAAQLRDYIRRAKQILEARAPHSNLERIQRWLRGFVPDPKAQVRQALEQRFLEEAHAIALIKQLASKMQYPQDKTRLENIERRKQTHLERLKAFIGHFDGTVPSFTTPDLSGRTWRGLAAALAQEIRDIERYHELRPLLQDDQKMVQQLELMIEEERINKSDLLELMGQLDPYANGESIWAKEMEFPEQKLGDA
jgi:rubrerythrin